MNKLKWIITIIFIIPAMLLTITLNIITLLLFLILGIPGLIFGKRQELYIMNSLISIDQLYNAVAMFGDPDETISSRAGRRWPNSLWAKFIDLLFFAQKGKRHVLAAIEEDEQFKEDLI